MMDINPVLTELRARVDEYLEQCFREKTPYHTLLEAMSYSLTAGGKRVRPILTMQFCAAAGGDAVKALPLGCGVEMLHTYSRRSALYGQ